MGRKKPVNKSTHHEYFCRDARSPPKRQQWEKVLSNKHAWDKGAVSSVSYLKVEGQCQALGSAGLPFHVSYSSEYKAGTAKTPVLWECNDLPSMQA